MPRLSHLQKNVLTGFLEAAERGEPGVAIGSYKAMPVRALLRMGYIEPDQTKKFYRITSDGRSAVNSSASGIEKP